MQALASEDEGTQVSSLMNKIDLAQARPEEVARQMEHTLSIDADEILRVSAKTGVGASQLLDAIIDRVPPPAGDPAGPL